VEGLLIALSVFALGLMAGRATMAIDPAGRSSFREPPMLHHISGSDDAPVIVAHDNMTLG